MPDIARVALSGPLRPFRRYRPLFQDIERAIREWGVDVWNPASQPIIDGRITWTNPDEATQEQHRAALKVCLREILASQIVVALPGWEESRGARLEAFVAADLGIPVVFPAQWHPVATTTALHKFFAENT